MQRCSVCILFRSCLIIGLNQAVNCWEDILMEGMNNLQACKYISLNKGPIYSTFLLDRTEH